MAEKEIQTNELVKAAENTPVMPFSNSEGFALAQRMASALAQSSLVPQAYQGKVGLPNCLIALEMAQRVGISPLLVMQNMHIIQGRPSWSATYLIAAINTSGKFSPLRFRIERLGKKKVDYTYSYWSDGSNGRKSKQYKTESQEIEEITCVAYATEIATSEILEAPEVSISMAVAEGWYTKDGSKWKTMPELMLRYRAAAFFSRMYCPEVAMGLHTAEEVYDVYDATPAKVDAKERAKNLTEELLSEPAPEIETEFLPPEPEPAPAPEPAVVETAALKAEPKPEPKAQPRAEAKQEQLLPPDNAFDFPEMDDGDPEALF